MDFIHPCRAAFKLCHMTYGNDNDVDIEDDLIPDLE